MLANLTATNNVNNGIYFQEADSINMTNILTANNGQNGIYAKSTWGGTFNNIISYGNGNRGIYHFYWPNSMLLGQLALFNNAVGGIEFNNVDDSQFFDNLLLGGNGNDCLESGGTNPGIDSSCNSAAHLVNGVNVNSSFIGMVTSDDEVNSSDTLGIAPFSSLLDWIGFTHPYRTWGAASGSLNSASGRCSTGNCQIIDWSLSSSDTALLNRTEDGLNPNDPFIPGSPCPSSVDGSNFLANNYYEFEVLGDGLGNENSTCNSGEICQPAATFLKNATEIELDHIGNDNGLCESGEACLYSPNFGVYQGHGDYLSQGTCIFSNGTISDVKLYAYPTNGY